jgi:hypothetical protein
MKKIEFETVRNLKEVKRLVSMILSPNHGLPEEVEAKIYRLLNYEILKAENLIQTADEIDPPEISNFESEPNF